MCWKKRLSSTLDSARGGRLYVRKLGITFIKLRHGTLGVSHIAYQRASGPVPGVEQQDYLYCDDYLHGSLVYFADLCLVRFH